MVQMNILFSLMKTGSQCYLSLLYYSIMKFPLSGYLPVFHLLTKCLVEKDFSGVAPSLFQEQPAQAKQVLQPCSLMPPVSEKRNVYILRLKSRHSRLYGT